MAPTNDNTVVIITQEVSVWRPLNLAKCNAFKAAFTEAGGKTYRGDAEATCGDDSGECAQLTSWQAGTQPLDAALRDLRMSRAVARFISRAPTLNGKAGRL